MRCVLNPSRIGERHPVAWKVNTGVVHTFLCALKNGLARHTGVGCVNEAQYFGCYYCYYYNRIH